jgi:hypothetical protein
MNDGNEKPNTAIAITDRSTQVPTFQAASIPSGTAMTTAISSDTIASAIVGSSRCTIMWLTGWLPKIELPKSPCSRFQSQ